MYYIADCRSKYSLFSCQVQKTIFQATPKSVTNAWKCISFKTAKADTTTTSTNLRKT